MLPLLTAFLMLTAFAAGPVRAQGVLDQPRGEALLEVTGLVATTNAPYRAVFDRDMLEALGSRTITTTTPWHAGQVRFEGVPLGKLMEAVGAYGQTVRAVALNDYVITIPITDFVKHDAVLALKRDGQYMSVRDKGPLFIVYPYDSKPELKSQLYYARSVWQLKRLDVLP